MTEQILLRIIRQFALGMESPTVISPAIVELFSEQDEPFESSMNGSHMKRCHPSYLLVRVASVKLETIELLRHFGRYFPATDRGLALSFFLGYLVGEITYKMRAKHLYFFGGDESPLCK